MLLQEVGWCFNKARTIITIILISGASFEFKHKPQVRKVKSPRRGLELAAYNQVAISKFYIRNKQFKFNPVISPLQYSRQCLHTLGQEVGSRHSEELWINLNTMN